MQNRVYLLDYSSFYLRFCVPILFLPTLFLPILLCTYTFLYLSTFKSPYIYVLSFMHLFFMFIYLHHLACHFSMHLVHLFFLLY